MNVDYDIEQFWLGFKVNIEKFYEDKNINRPIKQWSDNLNALQKHNKYEEIEHSITRYISLYALDLMRANDSYNINILTTNIKRWDRISNKYKIFDKNKDYNQGCNLITTLLYIYNIMNEKGKPDQGIFDQIELFLIFGDFSKLIKHSYDSAMPSIIDKLLNYDITIFNQVKQVFNLEEDKIYPLSGTKLFKFIKNKQQNNIKNTFSSSKENTSSTSTKN